MFGNLPGIVLVLAWLRRNPDSIKVSDLATLLAARSKTDEIIARTFGFFDRLLQQIIVCAS